MRIGLFGGAFDPIHIGHLIIGQFSFEKLNLDKVIFIPANVSPFKKNKESFFSPNDRFEMVKLAIEDNPNFKVSDFELSSNQISYSYITVDYFSKIYHDSEIFFIIGGDNLLNFCKWKNYEYIISKVSLIVYPRLGFELVIPNCLESYANKIFFLEVPIIDISSTMIRQRIKDGMDVKYFLPNKVYEYIKNNLNLY